MKDATRTIEALLTDLAADPSFSAFVRPEAGLLVWDAAGTRLLHASDPARGLAHGLADADGSIRPTAVAPRLRALAGGLAPLNGMRLERLRLDPGRLAPPLTCACRRATLPDGASVLVTAIIDPLPKGAAAAPVEAPPAATPASETQSDASAASPALPAQEAAPGPVAGEPAAFTPSGTVRFVWQADAETRFLQVSPALAEVVGPMAADIVGLTWAEIAHSVAEDGADVAGRLARRETFSGRTVFWTVDNTELQVPVDWAGMPVFGPDRILTGFRGFGLLRTDAARPRPAAAQPAPNADPAPEQALATVELDASPAGDLILSQGAPMADEAPPAAEPAEERSDALTDDALTEHALRPAESREAAEAAEYRGPDDRADAPEADPAQNEDSWFAGIRERVAATLSGAKAAMKGEARDEAPAGKPRADHGLSQEERSAFREIARALGARFDDEAPASPSAQPVAANAASPLSPPIEDSVLPQAAPPARHPEADAASNSVSALEGKASPQPTDEAGAALVVAGPVSVPAAPAPASVHKGEGINANPEAMLDRLPTAILVHRGERVLFANRVLLDLVDYDDVAQIAAEGGLVRLFRGSPTLLRSDEGGSPLALTNRRDESIAVEVRLSTVEWDGLPAGLMMIRKVPDLDARERLRSTEADLRLKDGRVRELEAILDTATDGVVVVDETGRILSVNRSAEALFGYDGREVVGDAVTVLLAPESHIVALDYLEGLRSSGVASLLNDGREVLGRVRQGGTIPLFMTMGSVNDGPQPKFCAVLRDITAFKKAEGELIAAKRAAEEANAQKSDLLAKISHEIRTPLNAIIGFAEVMLEERFGPIGNERYKEYLKDVHGSGAHVISLVNDLLDLAKIEAGRMDLAFASVSLNDLVGSCVTLLQPQAARDRIVMRTSFGAKLPAVMADERSVRQIVLNLVSNAIKFTDAGGQVIVSTAITDRGEVAFRVRDTGIGMTEEEIEAALEPFRQLATARKRGGTGLGLPLTKALVEANRGALQISSNPNEGTLVEVLFPPTRVFSPS